MSYRKTNFDPFRRNKLKTNCKFYYAYDKQRKNLRILTTIAQLNFFKWAVTSGIIEHIDTNYEVLNAEMTKINKTPTIKKQKINSIITVAKNRSTLLKVIF